MSRLQHQIVHAPVGMDLASDPPLIGESFARRVEGFFPARDGVLMPSQPLQPIFDYPSLRRGFCLYVNPYVSAGQEALGVFTRDWVIEVVDNLVVARRVNYHSFLQQVVDLGEQVQLGQLPDTSYWLLPHMSRVRFLQIGGELFLTTMTGIRPRRIYADANNQLFMRQVGIDTPAAPSVADNGAGNLTADSLYQYVVTGADERLRESSPSAAVSITTGGTARQNRVTFTWPTDLQVQTVYIYRTLAGQALFYRVGTVTSRATTTYDDNTADNVAAAAVQAPYAGQNDPPQPCSLMAYHKGRLFTNSYQVDPTQPAIPAVNSGRLQISNLSAPTQFSTADFATVLATGMAISLTDGTQLDIGGDVGDEVMGLLPLGGSLLVMKRYGAWMVWGTDPSDFAIERLHDVGCIAPETLVQYRGAIVWRGPDDLYIASAAEGFQPVRLSRAITPALRGKYGTPRE